MFSAALAAALLALPAAQAMFIMTASSLVTQRLDPIIAPGKVASHVHTVLGASNFNPNVDIDQQMASNCTSVPVQADKSLYWAPTLFHRAQNGTFEAIDLSFANLYYLQRDGPTQKDIKAVPKGLRMIAGNQYRTAYNASNVPDKAINFVCLNYNDPSNDASPHPTFPQRQCPDGVRLQVNFPSCWDGKNLDSDDHKSHVSYPIGGAPDSGDCPATHPVKMVLVFNEYAFDTGKFDYIPGGSSWVLSTGDDTGLTFHADYMAGWDVDVLQAAIDQCTTNLFGNLEACPPLVPSLNRDLASKCAITPVVQENVVAPRTNLPGCNPFTPGKPNGAASFCNGLAVPAIAGFSPAQPGTPAAPASSAAASSASAVASSKPAPPPASSTAVAASTATNVLKPIRTVSASVSAASAASSAKSASSSFATASAGLGAPPKVCKRNAGPSRRRADEAKYLKAVRAHHAGMKRH